jgi:type 1 fimbria pilin
MGKLILLGALVLLMVSMISLTIAATTNPNITTVIAGKIYDSPNFETANGVSGANVNVTCNSINLTTISKGDGTYSVTFFENQGNYCPNNDSVSVTAEKDGVGSGRGKGIVYNYTTIMPDLYIGVVNIALVPEFGVIAGVITILGAVGAFFVIRRK